MFSSQIPFVQLFDAVGCCRKPEKWPCVLLQHSELVAQISAWLDSYRKRTMANWSVATSEDLCCLYAMSRITSLMLLRFQNGRADGTDYSGLAITIDDFVRFHVDLGFTVNETTEFHPINYEIGGVISLQDVTAPIRMLDFRWPCLMLNDMVYCRGNALVQCGSFHAAKNIAAVSKLFWSYRRKDRPCEDQSHGWGHNSQWRTAFRRDYIRGSDLHYNVDGELALNELHCDCGGIPREMLIEVVRNRCIIKAHIDISDLYPYPYCYTEKA